MSDKKIEFEIHPPLKTPEEVIKEIVSKYINIQEDINSLTEELFLAAEELNLIKLVTEEEVKNIIKNDFSGAVLFRFSQYPEREVLIMESATVSNVKEIIENRRKENRLSWIRETILSSTGSDITETEIPEKLKELLTKKV